MQRLLAAALREPRNQRFAVLSESGVPLYPALVVYQALMGEPRSRVAACRDSALLPPRVRGFASLTAPWFCHKTLSRGLGGRLAWIRACC